MEEQDVAVVPVDPAGVPLSRASALGRVRRYAANNSVSGPSLFVDFGLPLTTTDSVAMKECQIGVASSRKF